MENNEEMLDCLIVQILRDKTGNLLVAIRVNIKRGELRTIWYVYVAMVLEPTN